MRYSVRDSDSEISDETAGRDRRSGKMIDAVKESVHMGLYFLNMELIPACLAWNLQEKFFYPISPDRMSYLTSVLAGWQVEKRKLKESR